jgi:hypothetical protein
VHEAASFGVPVVVTEFPRAQLGWENSRDLLAADTDPPAFAAVVVSLYRDAALWQTLRDNALATICAEDGRAEYEAAI